MGTVSSLSPRPSGSTEEEQPAYEAPASGYLAPRFTAGTLVHVVLPGEVHSALAVVVRAPRNAVAEPYALRILRESRRAVAYENAMQDATPAARRSATEGGST